MKYLPLVWSAFRRHTIESLLTFLVIVVAFTLFGSMVALKAAYEHAINVNRMDRMVVFERFATRGLPFGLREQLLRIDGVRGVGLIMGIWGYHQDPARGIGVYLLDGETVSAIPELRLTPEHWKALDATPNGLFFARTEAEKWTVKLGDAFPVKAFAPIRADGGDTFEFTVLGIVDDPDEDMAWMPHIYGNARYFDALLPEKSRGHGTFIIAADDPDKASSLCQQIDATYANSQHATYCVPLREDARQLAESALNMRQMSLGVAAAGLFMILFLCVNGIAESVRERMPEFAVLKTIGFNDRAIAIVVGLEAALPSIAGALLGTALAWALSALVPRLVDRGVLDIPQPTMSLAVVSLALVAALLIAAASAVLPLRRLRSMPIDEVLAGR